MSAFDPVGDPVWAGRVPTTAQGQIEALLVKPLEDLDAAEITTLVEECERIIAEAQQEEVDDIISNAGTRFRDDYHKRPFVAMWAGDKYLAEEIIQRGT